jgi:glycosyltransferase involved in cell wall biosynthesis
VLSDAEAAGVVQLVPDLKPTILPNAVAADSFPLVKREGQTKNIIYLGRLHKAKGLDDIVESCRTLDAEGFRFKFSCYGAGPDQGRFVTAMTQTLGENFHFGGVVSGNGKVRAFGAADIFLMPSKFEGLPLSLLEAMAAGCIPIVSNRGAMPSVVEDGRNGFLVEPGDVTQIVARLKFLLSENATGWNAIRENARRTIVDGYDLAQYARRLEDLYGELLAPSGRPERDTH